MEAMNRFLEVLRRFSIVVLWVGLVLFSTLLLRNADADGYTTLHQMMLFFAMLLFGVGCTALVNWIFAEPKK